VWSVSYLAGVYAKINPPVYICMPKFSTAMHALPIDSLECMSIILGVATCRHSCPEIAHLAVACLVHPVMHHPVTCLLQG
jgi:hypothetical protein